MHRGELKDTEYTRIGDIRDIGILLENRMHASGHKIGCKKDSQMIQDTTAQESLQIGLDKGKLWFSNLR